MKMLHHLLAWLAIAITLGTMHAGAADVIGRTPPEWQAEGWLNSGPLTLEALKGKVVLVRWWTAPECPHCAATAPVLNAFHQDYKDKGLVVVGMYHHKSTTPLNADEVAVHAKRLGFAFPVAIDRDWMTFEKMVAGYRRPALDERELPHRQAWCDTPRASRWTVSAGQR